LRTRLFKATGTGFQDWPDVFSRARPGRVTTIVTGRRTQNAAASSPVLCHLIQIADADERAPDGDHEFALRHYLIDAGLDSSFVRDPYGSVRGLLRRWLTDPMHQLPGEGIRDQLEHRGLRAIDGIFFTHLHFDCTSGLNELAQPRLCLIGHGERSPEHWPWVYAQHLDRIGPIGELSFEKAAEMAPLGPCIDLLGHGTVWAIPTPGHTLGHVSYLVATEDGPVLLAGDAVPTRRTLHEKSASGRERYSELALASATRVKAFLETFPQVRPVFGRELGTADTLRQALAEAAPSQSEPRAQGRFE
jgi:N-acyl homoserine lactone hydrolase